LGALPIERSNLRSLLIDLIAQKTDAASQSFPGSPVPAGGSSPAAPCERDPGKHGDVFRNELIKLGSADFLR